MNSRTERQILLAALRAREAKSISPKFRLALMIVIWLALAASVAVGVVQVGQPSAGQLAVMGVAFVVGLATGAFAFVEQSKKTWPVITDYIDFQRIQKRLSEIEKQKHDQHRPPTD